MAKKYYLKEVKRELLVYALTASKESLMNEEHLKTQLVWSVLALWITTNDLIGKRLELIKRGENYEIPNFKLGPIETVTGTFVLGDKHKVLNATDSEIIEEEAPEDSEITIDLTI